ncbi:hypothetical protein T484DRAFT_1825769 [Baffinella frigidus]|nr:hypothetical protein T484DRAFT_1825769 [Cryptophyta sp. CCMP2293]
MVRSCGGTGFSVAEQLPRFSVTAEIRRRPGVDGGGEGKQPQNRAGGGATVVVTAVQGNRRKRGIKAYAPKVARARDEGWWVVVGCYQSDEILAIKRVVLRRESTVVPLEVVLPEQPGDTTLTVQLVSDTYLGLDARTALPLRLSTK